jgi:hypothetical protein
MRYFLDTEFYEDGVTIDLISLGMVCEDGRALYVVNQDANLSRVSTWVRANVLPQLPVYGDPSWMTRAAMRDEITNFMHPEKHPTNPQVWAYYADYDWVVFCQIFGTMMGLPKWMPKFCLDLKQLAVEKGNPTLPKQKSEEHHALGDARWNRDVYEMLKSLPYVEGAM